MSTKKNHLIEELIEKISGAIPPGFSDFQDDFKSQVRALINKAFNECGIVTQEEFEAYRHALEQMQKRVKTLEKKIEALKPRA